MCTSSPGEQSLASRVNPTISAYSILQIEKYILINLYNGFLEITIAFKTINIQYIWAAVNLYRTAWLYTRGKYKQIKHA